MPPFLQIQFIIGDLGNTFNNEIGNLIMHVKWFKRIVYIDNIYSLVPSNQLQNIYGTNYRLILIRICLT